MSNLTVKGNASGTGTVILEAPNTNSNRTITLPDSTSTLASTAYVDSSVAAIATGPTLGTAVASTSGTAIDFTGIPLTAKRVTVMFSGVSTNGTSSRIIRIGGSGGIESSGYLSAAWTSAVAGTYVNTTIGFVLTFTATSAAAGTLNGSFVLTNITGNTWVASGSFYDPNYGAGVASAGSKTISTTLDRIRITTAIETDAFDAGTINIMWEG